MNIQEKLWTWESKVDAIIGVEGFTECTDVMLLLVLVISDSPPEETNANLGNYLAAKITTPFNLVNSKYFI